MTIPLTITITITIAIAITTTTIIIILIITALYCITPILYYSKCIASSLEPARHCLLLRACTAAK
eukprot:11183828-Lingulodinium_polyedra.AAC.1